MLTRPHFGGSVGGCCGSGGISMLMRGCNSIALASTQIDVYDHSGGTLLTTVTTDGTGHGNFPSGTHWLIPHNGRFVGQTVTTSSGLTVTFSPVSNYHCVGGCAIPLPETLNLTDSVLGSATLTWNGTNWVGTLSYSFVDAYCGCSSKTVTITYTMGPNVGGSNPVVDAAWKYNNPPFLFYCPDDTGLFSIQLSTGGGSRSYALVCPPSFSLVTTVSYSGTGCAFAVSVLYNLGTGIVSGSFTITVTE